MDICFRRVGGAAGKFPMAMIEAKRREFLDAEELTTVQGNNEISHADKERGHFGVDHHHHRDLSQIMGNAASRFFAAVMPSTTSATPRRGRFGSRWSSDTAASSSDASPTHHYQQTRPSSRANKQRELQMLAVDALSATSDSELDSGNDEHEDTANVVIAISSSTTAATLATTATNTTNNTATSNAPPTPDSMVEMMDMLKLSPLTTSAPTAPSSLQAGRSRRGTATTATTAAYVRAVPSTVQVGEEQTKQGL